MWLQSLDLNYLSVLSQPDASDAIAQVGAERTSLGAVESQLQAALSYGQNEHEQLLGAYSRIRDADIAVELTEQVRQSMRGQFALSAAEVVRFCDRQSLKVVTTVPPGGGRIFRAAFRPAVTPPPAGA